MFCEYLTVLRNGRDVGTSRVDDISDDDVIRMIIGRSLSSTFPPRVSTAVAGAVPALAGRCLSIDRRLRDVSFALAPGEVLGVAGLQGMGQLSCSSRASGRCRSTPGRSWWTASR